MRRSGPARHDTQRSAYLTYLIDGLERVREADWRRRTERACQRLKDKGGESSERDAQQPGIDPTAPQAPPRQSIMLPYQP